MKILNALILLVSGLSLFACGGTGIGNGESPTTSTNAPTQALLGSTEVLNSICAVLTTCNSGLTNFQCESGVQSIAGMDVKLGLTTGSYASFSAIISAESQGAIQSNSSAVTQCQADLQSLSCSSAAVMNAYQSQSANPFSQVPSMMPSGVGSCPAVF
jgi:hypothetical protein